MKRISRVPPTKTDEVTTATNVPLDLPDGDGNGNGNDNDNDTWEPRKHGLRWKAQIEINNILLSIV